METKSTPEPLFEELWFQTITPLHVGVGQDVGIVDLPIARERTTGYPLVPGSGIRGALRSRAARSAATDRGEPSRARGSTTARDEPTQETSQPGQASAGDEVDQSKDDASSGADIGPAPAKGSESIVDRLFGPDQSPTPRSGCLSVLDARILLFPVRSSHDVFQWVTCPHVLHRYRADRCFFLGDPSPVEEPPEPQPERFFGGACGAEERVYLEEYPFEPPTGTSWTWPFSFPPAQRTLLISDDAFTYFVEHATLVRQRNHLTTAKTVARGQLFTVEAVPPEALFYGFVGAVEERRAYEPRLDVEAVHGKLRALLADDGSTTCHLVLGGHESVGMGMTEVTWRNNRA